MSEYIKAKGIVLNAIDYKDYDKLVTLYLFGYGKILAKINSYKKSNKYKAAAINMSFGEYDINTKRNNSIIGHDLIDAFMTSNSDIKKYYAKCSVIEIFTKIIKDKIIKDDIALLVLNFLKSVEYSEDTEEKYLAFTLIKILQKEGHISTFINNKKINEDFIRKVNFEYIDKDYKNFTSEDSGDFLSKKGILQLQYFYDLENKEDLDGINSCKVEKNIIKWLFKYIEFKFELNLNSYKEYIKF